MKATIVDVVDGAILAELEVDNMFNVGDVIVTANRPMQVVQRTIQLTNKIAQVGIIGSTKPKSNTATEWYIMARDLPIQKEEIRKDANV